MSCDTIQAELVAYHFGTESDETRDAVEAHLLECSQCLRDYLALKRAIETGEGAPAPSEAARVKIRRSVALALGVEREERAWSWWERPLAVAFASAALVCAVAGTRVLTSGPGSPPHAVSMQPTR